MRFFKLKVIAPVLIIGAVATAAFASAAVLNVNSQGLQAGTVRIAACQGDAAVNVSYNTSYNNVIGFIEITDVIVSNIAPACQPTAAGGAPTNTIRVVLQFGPPGGGSMDLGTLNITGPTVTFSLAPGSRPSAADLVGAAVLIKSI